MRAGSQARRLAHPQRHSPADASGSPALLIAIAIFGGVTACGATLPDARTASLLACETGCGAAWDAGWCACRRRRKKCLTRHFRERRPAGFAACVSRLVLPRGRGAHAALKKMKKTACAFFANRLYAGPFFHSRA